MPLARQVVLVSPPPLFFHTMLPLPIGLNDAKVVTAAVDGDAASTPAVNSAAVAMVLSVFILPS